MFTKDPNHPGNIDSVQAVEGKFKWRPDMDKDPILEITMVYLNRETKTTFGTCPVDSSLFSPKTMEAFKAFLESAETDFGTIVFERGQPAPFGETQGTQEAESSRGLPTGLGGT